MNQNDRITLRPVIESINDIEDKSVEEQFQNKTLRPIIKLQHELLVDYFKAYISSKKFKVEQVSKEKMATFIKTAFLKDNVFKAELKGIIIGHFITDEFAQYLVNKSEYNKRILTMVQQRVLSVFL